MACPADHETYFSRADAARVLAELIAHAKRTGKGGTSWKRLHVFRCGNHFHIGRSRSFGNRKAKPAPQPKPPSFGDLRRKVERMSREWDRKDDYQRRKRAEAIGKLIEAEKAIEESKLELAAAQREVLALFFPE